MIVPYYRFFLLRAFGLMFRGDSGMLSVFFSSNLLVLGRWFIRLTGSTYSNLLCAQWLSIF